MGEDDGRVIIGQFADATSNEEGKHNRHLAYALQHHNEAAAHAAQALGMMRVVKEQFDDSEFKKALDGVYDALEDGYYASNSHKGSFIRDFLVKEHRVIAPGQNAKGSIIDRLTGKSNSNPQVQT